MLSPIVESYCIVAFESLACAAGLTPSNLAKILNLALIDPRVVEGMVNGNEEFHTSSGPRLRGGAEARRKPQG